MMSHLDSGTDDVNTARKARDDADNHGHDSKDGLEDGQHRQKDPDGHHTDF